MALGQKIDSCFDLAVVFVNWWNYTNDLVPFTHSFNAFCPLAQGSCSGILSPDPLWILYTLLCVWSRYPMWYSLCGFNIYCILNTISMDYQWYVKYVSNSVCLTLVVTKHFSPNMPEIRTTQVNKRRITSPFAWVVSFLWDSLTKMKGVLATNCKCKVTFTCGNCSLAPV